VWRRTRGLRSSEIATLADHREALLVSIREGVIAVGTDGRVTTANDSARDLLGLPADVVGRHVSELGLAAPVEELLLSEEESHDAVLVVGDRVLVFNQRAASSRGEGIGTVTTMRDRTELVSMQSQLSSNLSLTDTLRAQTHEFANKLHTISGLVQLEEYDEVVTLIGDMTRRRQELVRHVSDRVVDLPLAALVIAKSSVADEAGVELELDEDSSLEALPADVSADLVTVVGNLVDNALDACRGGVRPRVRLRLRSDDARVTVEVRDNGPGVPEEAKDSIFVRGFSTKGDVAEGRGIGLALVQLICGQRGGSVTTTRELDETVFRVVLPLARTVAGSAS
jgi:sensor histidine kinase regulating citrate/malate metabolism